MKSIIVARGKNGEIGAHNDLLWMGDMPADLRYFKALTTGKSVIMGLATYHSIGRALPNRKNIVLSRDPVEIDGVRIARSIPEAYALAGEDCFVIGGGSVYAQTLGDMDRLYITEVKASFPHATVFFPPLGSEWVEKSRQQHAADENNKYAYDFVVYEKA